MAGNANSGNRGERRGKPLRVRITLTKDNARRMQTIAIQQTDIPIDVNAMVKAWLDLHYPEPPQP